MTKDIKTFILKPEHILLLRSMFVDWNDCETGAPTIDPKRPYGNSDVFDDMREILGKPLKPEVLDTLHKETQIALQIILKSCNESLCGEYQTEKYDYCNQNFKLVKPLK